MGLEENLRPSELSGSAVSELEASERSESAASTHFPDPL